MSPQSTGNKRFRGRIPVAGSRFSDRVREDLSAAVAESLGFSRVTLGMGAGGQVSRPDGLSAWIASTGTAWANILKTELSRVLDREVMLGVTRVEGRLVPFGQRVSAAARLRKEGWSEADAERLAGL